MPHHIALLAAASEIAAQVEEGLNLLDDALEIVKRTGGRWLEAELIRHKGELLLEQGDPEAAEELYRQALNIAQEGRQALGIARRREPRPAPPRPRSPRRRP
jgi:predicted negative regulator of RcsB-dependent stress response